MKTKLNQIIYTLLIPLLTLPLAARGVNIWEGTSGDGCNTAEGGCRFGDISKVILNILEFLFMIAVPITVGMIVWGAIQLMTSGGSTEKAKKAKKTMTMAVIGFVVVLASILIVNTVKRVLEVNAS